MIVSCGLENLLKSGPLLLFPGYSFVPVGNIKSRVLYTQAEVNFGRVIGLDSVNVVVPLSM